MNPDDLVSHVVPKWKESGIPHAVLRFPAILDEDPASYDPRPPGHGLAQALAQRDGGAGKGRRGDVRKIRLTHVCRGPARGILHSM